MLNITLLAFYLSKFISTSYLSISEQRRYLSGVGLRTYSAKRPVSLLEIPANLNTPPCCGKAVTYSRGLVCLGETGEGLLRSLVGVRSQGTFTVSGRIAVSKDFYGPWLNYGLGGTFYSLWSDYSLEGTFTVPG